MPITDMHDFLSDCVSAIEAEITFIDKEGGEQSYELLSGQREEKATGALYVFVLADALRLPEDASGNLRVDGKDYRAMVVSQEGNRVWLLLESSDEMPTFMPIAKLVVNETELLRKLKEKVEELSSIGRFGLGPKVFGEEAAKVGRQSPPKLDDRIAGQTEAALAQCIGSDVTFLWGPPGTGKTFTIAALVACLAELGETVLVTSHTHAAVEQALWALVEPPVRDRRSGYLYGTDLIENGRILKVGVPQSDKIPAKVCLEKYLEQKATERAEAIQILREEAVRLSDEVGRLADELDSWAEVADAERSYDAAVLANQRALADLERRKETRASARLAHELAIAGLKQARHSFLFGRGGRVQKAQIEEARRRSQLQAADAAVGAAEAVGIRTRTTMAEPLAKLVDARRRTEGFRSRETLEEERSQRQERLEDLRDGIQSLQASADEDAKQLVLDAVAVFATLTKLYMDRSLLNELSWDTVVIDEASMAMPPLVAYAASRAKKRIVVVGDMFQLPPIVRSDGDGPAALLGTDIFELRGITKAVDEHRSVDQLAKLFVQRRMHRDIATVSRKLIEGYRDLEDGPEVSSRATPAMVGAIGSTAPLVTVDISKFGPWSGKLPGSLSRFNFISAQVAVEIASLYAAAVPAPEEKDPPRIGIVTPYAAQRRFLNKLIQSLKLERWVMAGTVHTFQGNECDVIIFDSVLGEPHWTARFTNPTSFQEVRRDLNVAVTRARHQFVFVGDARWLKKHAKATSGFGKLWGVLEATGQHLDAADIVGDGFRARVAKSASEIRGWDVSQANKSAFYTEKDFYPAFVGDLFSARHRVVLYTPFIGKRRWPEIEPFIADLRSRDVDVYLLHKPPSDPEWRNGDPAFGHAVFSGLEAMGVHLVPMSGVHAKTIVIDSEIVYEGSLNWASQVASYEHMWRFESKDMAMLVERMLQLEPITQAYGAEDPQSSKCPNCRGRLVVVNQRETRGQFGSRDLQPVKLGCLNHEEDQSLCPKGYLRRVNARAPFLKPPTCPMGTSMKLTYARSGNPWSWKCGHGSCRPVRWARGDCIPKA